MRTTNFLLLSILIIVFSSCTKEEVPVPSALVKEWKFAISAKNENPAPASRNETGNATLQLYADKTLKFTISVTGLATTDALVAAHLHVGDVISNGGVVLDFKPTFVSGVATGTLTNVRVSLIDSLKSDVNEIYLNVHSTQVGSGLLRGQLNTKLEMVSDVALSGANEVPAVVTSAVGTALLRLTSNKKLYYKVTVTGLESSDALTASHIHKAATGVNGSVYLGLYTSLADFGTVKIITVDDAQIASLKVDAFYVNVHSVSKPAGVVRGQIR